MLGNFKRSFQVRGRCVEINRSIPETTSQIDNDVYTGFEGKQFNGICVALRDAHQQLVIRSFICLMFPNPSMRLISVANKTIEAKLTNSNRQV